MDIGYDADFIVENNPFASGNLTNIINQQQTAGVGDFVVTLPVNSTLSGIFAVSGLVCSIQPRRTEHLAATNACCFSDRIDLKRRSTRMARHG
jgi:hypothetical protein